MKKFDETYERLLEQYRLDESFLGTLGKLAFSPIKAYYNAVKGALQSTKIGQAFTELGGKNKKPSEKLKGVQGIINEIKGIIDETAKSSTKQITFKSKRDGSKEMFNIDDFFAKEKELDTSTPSPSASPQPAVVGKRVEIMRLAKQAVAGMDFSSMVDSNQNLIKSAIKTLTSDEDWKEENPDAKVDENQILSELKRMLKSQISRANTKVKFEDKLLWLYLLAPSTHIIEV